MANNHECVCKSASSHSPRVCCASCDFDSPCVTCHGRMFGFVARRTGSTSENVCHLFAEMDPEQPAVAIVNFINKVMLGPQLHR